MKRVITILTALIMLFSLFSCGKEKVKVQDLAVEEVMDHYSNSEYPYYSVSKLEYDHEAFKSGKYTIELYEIRVYHGNLKYDVWVGSVTYKGKEQTYIEEDDVTEISFDKVYGW